MCFGKPHWKSFVAARLTTPPGGAGCLQLFGEGRGEHQLFADHLTAEFRVQTEGRGRKVDDWQIRPERPDNHWFDCLVGAAVAASILGVKWDAGTAAGEAPRPKKVRKKVDIEELYRQAREIPAGAPLA
jgi:phage terminase large subunit GpA-like protein